MSKRVLLTDEIERRKANSLAIEMPGDEPDVVIDQPDLWPDDKIEAMTSAQEADDMSTLGRILLGDDYERFLAAGGTSMMAWTMFKDNVGVVGESSGS